MSNTYSANTLHILYVNGETFIRTYDDNKSMLLDLQRLSKNINVKAVTMYYQA